MRNRDSKHGLMFVTKEERAKKLEIQVSENFSLLVPNYMMEEKRVTKQTFSLFLRFCSDIFFFRKNCEIKKLSFLSYMLKASSLALGLQRVYNISFGSLRFILGVCDEWRRRIKCMNIRV